MFIRIKKWRNKIQSLKLLIEKVLLSQLYEIRVIYTIYTLERISINIILTGVRIWR